ncbi:hypothetical protein C5S53_09825 [Methanophagales archaeon]|nr:hypothetical protein C5S53_09825 [Methanophagales archaeon]
MAETKTVSAISVVLILSSFLLVGILQPVLGLEEGFGQLGDLKRGVEIYNQNVDDLPFIKSLIGEERINCKISLGDGNVLMYGIETGKGAKVISVEVAEISDPTMKVYTTESTICTIMNAEAPVSAFHDAFNTGTIKLEGVGLANELKVGVMGVATNIYGFIQGLKR